MSFERNPLIEVVNVKADSKGTQEHAETEAERRMNDLKDQAVRAVYGMQLKTAMNRLTLLEKLRVLSETGSLDAYDPAWYAPDGGGGYAR